MELWELIRKGAKEGLEIIKDELWVAGKTSRILKKRVELTSVQSDVRKLFTRLGGFVYEFHSRGEQEFYRDEGVKSVISQIEGHKNGIREIEIEIETIRGEERQKSHEKTWEDKDQHPTI